MKWMSGQVRSILVSACVALSIATAPAAAQNPRAGSAPPFSQVGQNAEGSGPNYVPSGKIVADSGFRPSRDGFSFENYGNEGKPVNLTPPNMERLFGNQVCLSGTGATCKLTPAAKRWMRAENTGMGGGHCMGFSVSALRLFAGTLQPLAFGGDTTNALQFKGNKGLQANLAESFVYQSIPAIVDKSFFRSPKGVLNFLIRELNKGTEFYTLGIYKSDLSDGHAITPLAVEDKGNGKYAILVYDNNYPSVTRAVDVDVNKNRYRYVGSTNPAEAEDVYSGGAKTRNLDLTPTLIGEKVQPCPFCDRKKAKANLEGGTVLPASQQYSEMTLSGDQDNHPHLIFTDTKGRQEGIIGGKVVEEIPGVEMVRRFADDETEGFPEPKFQIKPGTNAYVTIDGSHLKKTSKNNTVDFMGNGIVVLVDDIDIKPKQKDALFLPGAGYGLLYQYNGTALSTPLLFAGVEDGGSAYTFAATAAGLKKGSTISLIVLKESGQVLLDASDTKGSIEERGVYSLVVNKLDSKGNDYTWVDDGLRLSGAKDEGAYFNWKQQKLRPGKALNIEVGPEDGPFVTRKARYVK